MLVLGWKKTEKGKLCMCCMDFLTYYKLLEDGIISWF